MLLRFSSGLGCACLTKLKRLGMEKLRFVRPILVCAQKYNINLLPDLLLDKSGGASSYANATAVVVAVCS